MLEVDNTGKVLYHYLHALHVKVSKTTVYRLLDTPLGNSMRASVMHWTHSTSTMRHINFPKNF